MAILKNIDIDINIDKGILQNIDSDKISYRLGFGISNTPSLFSNPSPTPAHINLLIQPPPTCILFFFNLLPLFLLLSSALLFSNLFFSLLLLFSNTRPLQNHHPLVRIW